MANFHAGHGGYRIFNLQGIEIPDTGKSTALEGLYDAAKQLEPDTPLHVTNFLVNGGNNVKYGGIGSRIHMELPTTVRLAMAGYKELDIGTDNKLEWHAPTNSGTGAFWD